jgi:predicted PurR-regulated permease PerM
MTDRKLSFSMRSIWLMLFGIAAAFLIAWTSRILLLVFAGILGAVVLRRTAKWSARKLKVAPGWTLAGILIALLAALGAASVLWLPTVASEVAKLAADVPQAWGRFQERLQDLLGELPVGDVSQWFDGADQQTVQDLAMRGLSVAYGAVGTIVSLLLVVFLAIYMAADPGLYRGGLIKLMPPNRRPRTAEILDMVGDVLLWWMIGKFAQMLLVGIAIYLGLFFLGMPFALSLALLAAVLDFIPNFGPIIAAIPAILLASNDGTEQVGWILILYVGVQTVESYFLTPLVQQKTVSLPPALTITTQVIIGLLTGGLGLALATPLTAAGMVLIREVYVKDILEEGRYRDTAD